MREFFHNILFYIFHFLLVSSLFFTSSCGVLSNKPNTHTETIYNVIDSIQLHDSIVYIPKERIVDIVPIYDTLVLESSKAVSKSYVDTSRHVLRGSIENKSGIEYKYKYINKIEYRDSITIKEVPVEVEVIKNVKTHFWYEKILWIFSLIGLFFIAKILIKMYVNNPGMRR